MGAQIRSSRAADEPGFLSHLVENGLDLPSPELDELGCFVF